MPHFLMKDKKDYFKPVLLKPFVPRSVSVVISSTFVNTQLPSQQTGQITACAILSPVSTIWTWFDKLINNTHISPRYWLSTVPGVLITVSPNFIAQPLRGRTCISTPRNNSKYKPVCINLLSSGCNSNSRPSPPSSVVMYALKSNPLSPALA